MHGLKLAGIDLNHQMLSEQRYPNRSFCGAYRKGESGSLRYNRFCRVFLYSARTDLMKRSNLGNPLCKSGISPTEKQERTRLFRFDGIKPRGGVRGVEIET